MKRKPGVAIVAAAAGITLTLMGDVGWDITVSGVAAALRGHEGKPLTISLNSLGGSAFDGVAIHNVLARHKGPKTVIVEGVAASAASLIAMAGDRIVMPENSFLMIHNAWGGVVGQADEMREQAALLDMVSSAYRSTYAARTGLPEAEIAAMMSATTWMGAAEAVTRGFATEATAPRDIAAYASRAETLAEAPAAILAAFRPPSAIPEMPNMKATLAELRTIAARANLGADWVLAQAEAEATTVAATEAALDVLATASAQAAQAAAAQAAEATRVAAATAAANAAAAGAPAATPGFTVTRDAGDTLRARVSNAFAAQIAANARGVAVTYADDQREFAGIGMLGVARELMAAAGVRNVHRLDNAQVADMLLGGGAPFASGTHTTGDFVGVLANTLNKTVRELYGAYPNTWSAWTDEAEVGDYKQITAATIGQASEPEIFAEGGQVKIGTIAEDPAETYQVSERGILLPVSKQALVNDDTRALTRAAQNLALGAYTGLRRVVFGILTANANMADGNALFSTTHKNLGTAGAMTATSLGQLIALLDAQTGPTRAGRLAAPLPPTMSAALVTGSNNRRTALELLGATIVPNAKDAALPAEMRAMMAPVFDPFLNGASTPQPYYAVRTEAGMRPVEISYIRGQRTPQVTQAERIDYTGITFRVLFDFGAKAVTWRTGAANLG